MNKLISRYLSAQKFDWLLTDNGLYLGAAEHQSDKDEGKYDYTFLSRLIAENVPDPSPELIQATDKLQLDMQNFKRTDSYLSCWYLGAEESQEMWDEYGENGVLIFSDAWTLQDTLPDPLGHAAMFSEITYDDELKVLAALEPLLVKNLKFGNEREFRLIFDLTNYSVLTGFEARCIVYVGDTPSYLDESTIAGMSKEGIAQSHKVIRRKGDGLVLEYSLNLLIKEVRLHPAATDQELHEVERRLREKGIKCRVRHSSLRPTSQNSQV